MTAGKPIVLITGAAGAIGGALGAALEDEYRVVGLDMKGKRAEFPLIEIDLTDAASTAAALERFAAEYGREIAAVIHLAAYFDFTGEENPLYDKVNVEGTRNLLRALGGFEIDRLIYSGTMLVHAPGKPGESIDETAPVEPKWAYPNSKARAEEVIREERGDIPVLLLHLAGLYDEESAVPTLAHQITRIYERDMKSHLYAGDIRAGQSFIHRDDMMRLFRAAVDRRNELPPEAVVLAGEPEAVSYAELQEQIGRLVHGEEEWTTLTVPKPVAKVGAWVEEKAEPIIPDDIDQGEKPFIRPFMIDMAEDHYALDISRAKELLGWEPRHSIRETLPRLVASLKKDPVAWYGRNGITPPTWMETADKKDRNPEDLRRRHEAAYCAEHDRNIWAPLANAALGTWLITSPSILGYTGTWMGWSDIVAGLALLVFGLLSTQWTLHLARLGAGAAGLWLMLAPLVFWTPSAAAYLNGTLVGTLAIALAVVVRPSFTVSPVAALTGPEAPPGWSYNPSDYFQRAPVILLAFIGLYFSRYLAAYQLGHIEAAWDPFFAGTVAGLNGTESVISSDISEAWPVPDAGVGAVVYLLEILVGLIGCQRRWRTMPWAVLAFAILIVPLGIVSITFIIIQPILIGTWCALCLLGAAAMVLQIPFAVDELVATLSFLRRRRKAGAPVLMIIFTGDTDEGQAREQPAPVPAFSARAPKDVLAEMLSGGVRPTWNLLLCAVIGLSLMLTRITLGAEGAMADIDHLIGSLVVTVSVIAFAEVARPVRLLNVPLGLVLIAAPLLLGVGGLQIFAGVISGLLLIGLSLPRGRLVHRWGTYEEWIR